MIGTRFPIATALVVLAVRGASAQTATAKIVSNANAFLAALDENQRQSVLFAYNDEEQRKRWSNFPISMVPRAGLPFKDMTPAQNAAAMVLLTSALSPRGLEKVMQMVEGDEVLKTNEGSGRRARRWARWRFAVWKGSVLLLNPWNSFGEGSVDAAVRRASPGAQHND